LVEKQEIWDWKDVFSVAMAKGLVRIMVGEKTITVEGYSYYVAG